MIRTILKFAAVPLGLLIVFSIYVGLYNLFGLPTPKEILSLAKDSYSEHGYLIVFLGAIGEGLLMFNLYFPGSVMIVFGVTFSKGDPIRATILVMLTIIAFFITTVINYGLGKYGWYQVLVRLGLKQSLEKTRQRVEKRGLITLFITYVHPNLGVLTATSCGILKIPFMNFAFASVVALVLWNSLWGIIVYNFGSTVLRFATFSVFITLLVAWTIIAIIRALISNKRRNRESQKESYS